MDTKVTTDLNAKLETLQSDFKGKSLSQVSDIEKYWKNFVVDGENKLNDIHAIILDMMKSCRSHCASIISKSVIDLEKSVSSIIKKHANGLSASKNKQQKITIKIDNLKKIIEIWPKKNIFSNLPGYKISEDLNNNIYILEEDDVLYAYISVSLSQHGFKVKHFADHKKLISACENYLPAAVIIDRDFCNQVSLTKSSNIISENIPVVFLSDEDNMDVRLCAARAGVKRFFRKPLDMDELINCLMGLSKDAYQLPYRVLIVDNEDILLDFYKEVLTSEGVIVETLNNPLKGLEKLKKFKPDVLVTDVYMPGCSGPELVQVIRQDESWEALPIIFLSAEYDVESQLDAMALGGDEFIEKPVNAKKLIAVVSALAERSRKNIQLNKALKTALRESEFQLVTMDEHDIVSVTDVSGKITSVNDNFCEISGYNREELLGKNHSMLKSNSHTREFYDELWRCISNGKVWHGTICNRNKNGQEYWVESTIVPFLDDNGKPYKYASARTDVTELRESEKRLQRSQSFAKIGTWDWDIKTGSLFWSDCIWPLFGYVKEETSTTYENFLNAVHPEDREKVSQAVTDCVEKEKEYNIEHRVVWPDGTVRWMQESGDVIRSDDGGPLHMLGVVQDITVKIELEQKLLRQKKLLDMLHQSTIDFVAKGNFKESMDRLLETLLELTDSEYGFTGEILNDPDGAPFLKTHAISNIAWDDDTQHLYNNMEDKGFEFRNLDTLFGHVIRTGKAVVCNDPKNDSRSGGLPEGHPLMNNFLGVPIFHGDELVGMYGIANRDIGYDTEIQDFLRPFDVSYGAMIHSERMSKRESSIKNALIEAKDEADQASRAKSQFLSSMSHELRTPMNAIMGFSQLLKINPDKSLTESQLENINEILSAGEHLLELINEVLDLSKVESGRIELAFERVIMSDVIAESLQLIMPLAQKRGIEVEIKHDGEAVLYKDLSEYTTAVQADRTRLKQVFINILSNAIKYNTDDGKIIIKCDHEEPDQICISIVDTGAGLSKDQLEQLFQPFNRLGVEQSEMEGAGIGLVITKNIVELMNGSIGAESKVGVGSTFWFKLPRDLSEPMGVAGVKKQAEIENLVPGIENKSLVLYVEDNPANLRLVTQLLERRENINLMSAHEPYLGIDLAVTKKPDLILLDINLPGKNGFEVLKVLRESKETKKIPVIAISANAMPSDIDKGIEAGFNDYITKPINVKALLDVVDKQLAGN